MAESHDAEHQDYLEVQRPETRYTHTLTCPGLNDGSMDSGPTAQSDDLSLHERCASTVLPPSTSDRSNSDSALGDTAQNTASDAVPNDGSDNGEGDKNVSLH